MQVHTDKRLKYINFSVPETEKDSINHNMTPNSKHSNSLLTFKFTAAEVKLIKRILEFNGFKDIT